MSVTKVELDILAAQVRMYGFDEVGALRGTAETVAALSAMPGAKVTTQPWYSTVDRIWYVLTTVAVAHGGVTFSAQHRKLATDEELAHVRKLWSVP